MDVDHEVQRFSELLRLRIVASGKTQRSVEQMLGWSAGYVSQLLRGRQDLKLKQILAILATIGATPEDLLADLARPRKPWSPTAGGPADSAREEAETRITELLPQLWPMVREMVRETLEAQGAQETQGPEVFHLRPRKEAREDGEGAPPFLRPRARSSPKGDPRDAPTQRRQ